MVPLQSREESEALRKTSGEKMGPGSIFCCYVLKLRMSSFLQNGAWPHFFLEQNQRVLEISTLAHFAFRHKKEEVCGISFYIYTVQFLCYRLG